MGQICLVLCNRIFWNEMSKAFGESIREMREAQSLGLRVAAERLGISPAYLSRIERSKERPPKPELIKKMARLFGGDSDLLFRLSASTDPDIAEYLHLVPKAPEFLRTAMTLRLTSDDFAELIEEVKKRHSTAP
jgi:transcriptional regulator with XRE-family HTH domain